MSPTHPGHTCQRASPHDAHVVTGRTHHLSSPSWSSLRRRQLCCCCSWTSWRSSDGLVRDGGLRRRYEDDIVTAAELIGLFEPKVLALPARALRSTPRLRSVTAQRLRVAQTSCFPLTACCACRPRAGPTIPQPASSSTARTSTFCRRPRWTSSARVQQAAGGRAASCLASLGAVGSRTRVACGLPRLGRRQGRRARAHGQCPCACLACTMLYYKKCDARVSRAKKGVCKWPVCRCELTVCPS